MTSARLDLAGFKAAFPQDLEAAQRLDAPNFAARVEAAFDVSIPIELRTLWGSVGAGYFGCDRDLYIFGETQPIGGRESLVEWMSEPAWAEIFPAPAAGGPLFFAETCFGSQIGFRVDEQEVIPILFEIDTFESFVLGRSLKDLIENVLCDPTALCDPGRAKAVAGRLGQLPLGYHYAPIVSPLLGGSDNAENFHLETPRVHLLTALATFKAVKNATPGERISGVDIEWT